MEAKFKFCEKKKENSDLQINPFTAKCDQRQISSKFPNFIF